MDVVVQIRRATRNQLVEEKVRIVWEGLRGETLISELYRRERIAPTMYYRRLKALWDAGKSGLTRNTQRDAAAIEDRALKEENATLKKAIAESVLETRKYKKSRGM
jgi:transposase